MKLSPLVLTLAVVGGLGCGTDNRSGSAPSTDANALYPYVEPPSEDIPEARQANTWIEHVRDDLLPFWMAPEARGTPEGNFPTNRGMDGRVVPNHDRFVRMLSRQTYAYSVGYLVTGDPELLTLAHAGAQWILDNAWDDANGGWHRQLTKTGEPAGAHAKTAQDAAYAVLGLAAYYFVTRDAEAETAILRTRDLLFDSTKYFDESTGLIRDGLDVTLTEEVEEAGPGPELVAQLDPINAFLLLVQPVLSSQQRQAQFLEDLEGLSSVLLDRFFAQGMFWGGSDRIGEYRGWHTDFGHSLKAFWMVREVDKRLTDAPFHDRIEASVEDHVRRAYDAEGGRWAKRPTSDTDNELGSDWWAYAEADQIAATLSLADPNFGEILERTQAAWLTDYVDERYGEVYPSIKAHGAPAWPWSRSDTAKCNKWKNGYHSIEHALVMYLVGAYLERTPATLHFAVEPADASSFAARPYIFRGDEVGRSNLEPITVADRTLQPVRVEFDRLR